MITPENLLKSHTACALSAFGGAVGASARVVIACGLFASAVAWGGPVDEPPAPPAGRLVPGGTNGAKYLYVFGPEGDRRLGATGSAQVIWIRARRTQSQPVNIHVFDPGSGSRKEMGGRGGSFTKTKYTVYGGPGAYTGAGAKTAGPTPEQAGTVLVSSIFGNENRNEWVALGQFALAQGEAVGGNVYFKLVVAGVSGGSSNLFRLAISPPSVDAFTYAVSLALPWEKGQECRFYVAIPPGSSRVTEHNFDLDGMATCALQGLELKGSRNGRWEKNELTIPPSWGLRQRVTYQLVKTRNADDNTAVYFTDAQGVSLAIHFAPGASGGGK